MADDGSTCWMRLHERYLREAEELYASGDLAQAGEKYWGAVTALINAIAERRGLEPLLAEGLRRGHREVV
jgi:hypothetical protein